MLCAALCAALCVVLCCVVCRVALCVVFVGPLRVWCGRRRRACSVTVAVARVVWRLPSRVCEVWLCVVSRFVCVCARALRFV